MFYVITEIPRLQNLPTFPFKRVFPEKQHQRKWTLNEFFCYFSPLSIDLSWWSFFLIVFRKNFSYSCHFKNVHRFIFFWSTQFQQIAVVGFFRKENWNLRWTLNFTTQTAAHNSFPSPSKTLSAPYIFSTLDDDIWYIYVLTCL